VVAPPPANLPRPSALLALLVRPAGGCCRAGGPRDTETGFVVAATWAVLAPESHFLKEIFN